MKKHALLFILLPMLLLVQSPATATVYYVSPSGLDENKGTDASIPLRTVQKAATMMKAGDTCLIRKGTYRETVVPARSGTATAPMVFMPYNKESVVISGADSFTGTWSQSNGAVYKAPTSRKFIQLFCGGRMMNEARWPNAKVDSLVFMPFARCDSGTNAHTLVDKALPPGNWNGATVFIVPGPAYWSYTRGIKDYAPGVSFNFQTAGWPNATYYPKYDNRYYLFGALAGLDTASEWFLDTAAQMLYFQSPDSKNPNQHRVETKQRDYGFNLSNKSYITLHGLSFFSTALNMTNATHCTVEFCTMRYIDHARFINGNSYSDKNVVSGSYNTWSYCDLAYSVYSGIRVSGSYNRVRDCIIHDVNYAGVYAAAINCTQSRFSSFSYNTLYNSGRYLVMFNPATGAEKDTISYNDLHTFGTMTSDYGAIEMTTGDAGGTVISHNWVHHAVDPKIGIGIYFDSNGKNALIHHNVIWDCNHTGIRINCPADDNLIYNNTIINCPYPIGSTYIKEWDIPGGWAAGGPTFTNVRIVNNLSTQNQTYQHYGMTPNPAPEAHHNGIYQIDSLFFPRPGDSTAIDKGAIIPGITDGYKGKAPDIGAYETGAVRWVPGRRSLPPPTGAQRPATAPVINHMNDPVRIRQGGSRIHFSWKAGVNTMVSISINDISGREVAAGEIYGNTAGWTTRRLAPGMYFYRVVFRTPESVLHGPVKPLRIL